MERDGDRGRGRGRQGRLAYSIALGIGRSDEHDLRGRARPRAKGVGENIETPWTIETISPARTGRGGPAAAQCEECRPGVDDSMEGSEEDCTKNKDKIPNTLRSGTQN